MKIKKRKRFNFFKFNNFRIKNRRKSKSKLLPVCFALAITISTFLNNDQTRCQADNNKLYYIMKDILNNDIEVEVKPGKIEKISWEEYLLGVIAGEMPLSYNDEALKSQIVASKNYALYHLANQWINDKGKTKPLANGQLFQVYLNKEQREKMFKKDLEQKEQKCKLNINAVKDIFVFYKQTDKKTKITKEKLANTVYFSESSGKTENSKNVWGNEIPYLKSVDSSFEKNENNKINERKIEKTYDELFNIVKKNNSNAMQPEKKEDSIKINSRNETNHVKSVTAFGVELSGCQFRTICNLPSTNFEIEFTDQKIIFTCNGFGHDVGMSQKGAAILAKQGKKFDEILKHYYTGVEIKKIEDIKNNDFELEINNDETIKTAKESKKQFSMEQLT